MNQTLTSRLENLRTKLPNTNIDWLEQSFIKHYKNELPQPYFYPTPDDNVQVEWSINDWEVSLEIDLAQKIGALHIINTINHIEHINILTLNSDKHWSTLIKKIAQLT